MSRTDGLGTCEQCGRSFPYYLIHNGFNESAYAYCAECGQTALMDGWRMPFKLAADVHGPIKPEHEHLLQPCPCGGLFRASSGPRCPHCQKQLSPTKAAEWIEANAPGAKRGWRWQGSWRGLYAIVISDRVVRDIWRAEENAT